MATAAAAWSRPGVQAGSWDGLLPTEPIAFGTDFLWSVTSSASQAEGGEAANDWVELARAGRMPANPGNGICTRAEEDFRFVALGFRHDRLSIEWTRVEPAPGRVDAAAIDRYRAICDAATAAGLTPWVNFFHITHPTWFRDRGGFFVPANHDAAMANLLGDLWCDGEPDWRGAVSVPNAKLHLYGRAQPQPGRKMGHITAPADTPAEALAAAVAARHRLGRR